MGDTTVSETTIGLVTDHALLVSQEETMSNLSSENVMMTGFTGAEIVSGTVENMTAILTEGETNLKTAMGPRFLNPILSDHIFNRIQAYGLLVVVPLGLILNSLSFVIFQKSKTFATSIGSHMTCITISDNIFLARLFLLFY